MERQTIGTTGDDTFAGGAEDDLFKGLSGDDVANGGAGDDTLVGNTGNDQLFGGAGSDRLFGCEDDDVLDGGAGQDFLNAGSGQDRLIWNGADARGPGFDYYDGHNGIDRLELRLSAAQFQQSQAEIEEFLAFIVRTTGATGESGGRTADEFGSTDAGEFFFFGSLGLAARRIEELTVFVDGVAVIGSGARAEDDAEEGAADGPITGSVAANDTAPIGTTYTLLDAPARGTIILQPDGSFSFVPDESFVALTVGESEEVRFSYRLNTPGGEFAEASATITVRGVNDAPVTEPLSETVLEDAGPATFDLLREASDVDRSDTLSVANVVVTDSSGSSVTVPASLSGSSLSVDISDYQFLALGETRALDVTYDVSDGTASVPGTATLTITGENDAPVAEAITESVAEDAGTVSVDLLRSASDVDRSDALSVSNVVVTDSADSSDGESSDSESATNVPATLTGSELTVDISDYQFLADGETRELDVSYDVSDGTVTIPGSATITVTGENDAPVTTALSETIIEDAGSATFDLLRNASDIDSSDTLRVTDVVVTDNSGSPVVVAASLSGSEITVDISDYQFLAQGETRDLDVTYNVTDGIASVPGTATLTIVGQNDAPVTATINEAVLEDAGSASFDLLQNASDLDTSDALSVANIVVTDGAGTASTVPASLSGSELTVDISDYQFLAAGETRAIDVSYDVTDDTESVPGSAVLTITGENDDPTVEAPLSVTRDSDDADVTIDLLQGASDIDLLDELDVANFTVVSGDASGIARSGNSLTLDPSAYNELLVGQSEIIEIEFDVADGNGGFAAQTLTIRVDGTLAANTAPQVSGPVAGAFVEDESFAATGNVFVLDLLDGASDPDGDPLNVSDATISVNGVTGLVATQVGSELRIDTSQAVLQSFDTNSAPIELSLSYDISDGQGGTTAQTGTVEIFGANDAPTFTPIDLSVSEDAGTFVVDLLDGVNDIDAGDAVTLSNVSIKLPILPIAEGTFMLRQASAEGSRVVVDLESYQVLAAGETATISVDYTLSDGTARTFAFADLTVIGENDVPTVGAALSRSVDDQTVVTIDLLDGADDIDTTDVLSVANCRIVSGDDMGIALSGNALQIDGTAYAALFEGESETVEIAYDIIDGNGGVVAQTATIDIAGTGGNTVPQVDASVGTRTEDSAALTVDVLDQLPADTDGPGPVTVSNFEFTDENGDELPAGAVSVSGTSVTWDPTVFDFLNDGETATAVVTFDVSDGRDSASSRLFLEIQGVEDTPVAGAPIALTFSENDVSVDITDQVLAAVTDADQGDNALLTPVFVAGEGGTTPPDGATLDGDRVIFDASAYANGLNEGETTQVVLDVEVDDDFDDPSGPTSAVQRVIVTITGAGENNVPQVDATIETVDEDQPARDYDIASFVPADPDGPGPISLSNFELTDENGDELPSGAASVSGGTLFVDPRAFDSLNDGEEVFVILTYDVFDGEDSAPSELRVQVLGVEDAPIADVNFVVEIDETASPVNLTSQILSRVFDPDEGDTEILEIVALSDEFGNTAPEGATLDGSGRVFFDPSSYADGLEAGETLDIVLSATVDDDFDDGTGSGTATQLLTVRINGADAGNNAPTVSGPLTGSFFEDQIDVDDQILFTFELLQGASDPDGDDLVAINLQIASSNGQTIVFTLTEDGTAVRIPTGQAAFQPLGEGETLTLTLTYAVEDSNGASVPQTASLTVTGVNDRPVIAAPLTADAVEDALAPVVIDLTEGATDAEGDAISVVSATLVTGNDSGVSVDLGAGTLVLDPGAYELDAGATETISFEYILADGNGGERAGTATFTVTGVNDAPVATAQTITVSEDDADFTLDLLATATDADPSALLGVSNVSVSSSDDTAVVPPLIASEASFDLSNYQNLQDGEVLQFDYSYTVTDGTADTPTTATVIINGVNDAPTTTEFVFDVSVTDDSFTFDTLANVVDPDSPRANFTITDPILIEGDSAGFETDPPFTSITFQPGDYTLFDGESETLRISFVLNDGDGGSVTQLITFNIEGSGTPVNQPPEQDVPVTGSFQEDELFDVPGSEPTPFARFDLTEGAFDPEGDTLTVENLTLFYEPDTSAMVPFFLSGGTDLLLNTESALYQSLAVGETANIIANYDLSDGNGNTSPASAVITVTGTNDAPEGPTEFGVTLQDDQGLVVLDLSDGVTDIDASDVLSFDGLTTNESGVETGSINTSLDFFEIDTSAYGSNQGESRVVSFDFTIDDGNGGSLSRTATITIEGTALSGQNPPGIFGFDNELAFFEVSEGGSNRSRNISDSITSPGGLDLEVTAFLTPLVDGLSFDNASGEFTFDPSDPAYDSLREDEFVTLQTFFTVSDTDGGTTDASITVFLDGTNDAPVVTGPLAEQFTENGFSTVFIDMLEGASDVDRDDVLTVANIVDLPDGFFLSGNGLIVADPFDDAFDAIPTGATVDYQIDYDIVDAFGGSVSQTLTISVTGTNDAPEQTGTGNFTVQIVELGTPAELPEGSEEQIVVAADGAVLDFDMLSLVTDLDSPDLTVTGFTIESPNNIDYKNTVTVDSDGRLLIDFNNGPVPTTENFRVKVDVEDDKGASTTVSVRINTVDYNPNNQAPTTTGLLKISINEDDFTGPIDLFQNITDADGDPLFVEAIIGDEFGYVDFSTGVYNPFPRIPAIGLFTEAEGLFAEFEIIVGDGQGGHVAQFVEIEIVEQPDAPELRFDSPYSESFGEDDGIILLDLLQPIRDIDTEREDLIVEITSFGGDTNGLFNFDLIDGRYVAVVAEEYSYLTDGESATLVLGVRVGDGDATVTYSFEAEFTGSNDAPVEVRTARFFDNDVADYQNGSGNIQQFVVFPSDVFFEGDQSDFSAFTSVNVQGTSGVTATVGFDGEIFLFVPVELSNSLDPGERLDLVVDWTATSGPDTISGTFDYRIEGTDIPVVPMAEPPGDALRGDVLGAEALGKADLDVLVYERQDSTSDLAESAPQTDPAVVNTELSDFDSFDDLFLGIDMSLPDLFVPGQDVTIEAVFAALGLPGFEPSDDPELF